MKSFLAILLTVVLAATHAAALDQPKGPVILTITGAVTQPNRDGTAVFDLAMLDALNGRRATMDTPWTQGEVEFSGPLLREVLKAAGAEGSRLIFQALNGYSAEVPMSDALSLDTILATRLDGKVMTVRTKGPSMLVYPFDQDRSLFNEKYFARSVWQIKQIEVVE
ncbi:MAG: molybdopterin-dependent oxidoreductase [Alphaproteobacteria bacterium]|nr:molybdopterin-dependent oxidoreductase [Rhizobiaceae bacterium]MBU3964099.1 molybdopterin-dependent oxidoreductase [Alphaproteobacteria bacterium]MBU4048295.1 molybdopterin-dependent oxidoreductase [Alphaproteobacteria bacterium]MBU4089161.1 molybdopterin-dependent oxidoreductase [Alphaproteobacteria bacterium]MBU4158634.1 molybdopterin-dependent oxidoreductase [Alphaproteobacteria bacterium]